MKCKFCDGNVIEFNGNYACDKCSMLYELKDNELINLTCPTCLSMLEDGKCKFCEKEIVLNDEEEEAIMYCPDCGERLDIKGHCHTCGTKTDVTFDE